jgi:hypothetical protein
MRSPIRFMSYIYIYPIGTMYTRVECLLNPDPCLVSLVCPTLGLCPMVKQERYIYIDGKHGAALRFQYRDCLDASTREIIMTVSGFHASVFGRRRLSRREIKEHSMIYLDRFHVKCFGEGSSVSISKPCLFVTVLDGAKARIFGRIHDRSQGSTVSCPSFV